jgi:hypothetical protein
MVMTAEKKLTEQILKKTLELGADLAGMASIETLKNSPSHIIYGKLKLHPEKLPGRAVPCRPL